MSGVEVTRMGALATVAVGGVEYFFTDGSLVEPGARNLSLPGPLLASPMLGKRSSKWLACAQAFVRANPTCAACGTHEYLQVHHKRPFHLHPELELDPENLIGLCMLPGRSCHFRIGHTFDWHAWNECVKEDAELQLSRISQRKYTP